MAESSDVLLSSPMDNKPQSNSHSWLYQTTASKIAQASRRGEAKLRQLVLLNNAYGDFSSSATVWQREAENSWFQEVFDDVLDGNEDEDEDGFVSLSLGGEHEHVQATQFLYSEESPIPPTHATDSSNLSTPIDDPDELSESYSIPVSISPSSSSSRCFPIIIRFSFSNTDLLNV